MSSKLVNKQDAPTCNVLVNLRLCVNDMKLERKEEPTSNKSLVLRKDLASQEVYCSVGLVFMLRYIRGRILVKLYKNREGSTYCVIWKGSLAFHFKGRM
jgi:hypothetical protein